MFDLFDVKIPYVANSWNFVTARLKFIMVSIMIFNSRQNPSKQVLNSRFPIKSDHKEFFSLMIGF